MHLTLSGLHAPLVAILQKALPGVLQPVSKRSFAFCPRDMDQVMKVHAATHLACTCSGLVSMAPVACICRGGVPLTVSCS
jgi:hypothetical protein